MKRTRRQPQVRVTSMMFDNITNCCLVTRVCPQDGAWVRVQDFQNRRDFRVLDTHDAAKYLRRHGFGTYPKLRDALKCL